MTVRVAVLSGSIRAGSHNTALARLAAARATALGAEATLLDLAEADLPLYAHAIEEQGLPDGARRLKATLVASDVILMATPEYNGSISPLLKNAIDWASRPTDGESLVALSAYRGKCVGIMAASLGPFGGLRALMHLRQIMGTVQALVIPDQLAVPLAHAAFDEAGALRDPLLNSILDALVARAIDVGRRLTA